MKQDLLCLRCQTPMRYLRSEKLQMGQTSWIWGDWPNLLAGALEVEIYLCPQCGKLEFYSGIGNKESNATDCMAQKTCPQCGLEHDLDDPKCPRCKHHYYR